MLSNVSLRIAFLLPAVLTCSGALAAAPGTSAVNWAPDLVTAQQEAVRSGKLLLIHFSADNCPPCIRVEKNVLSQANVGYQIGTRFVPVHINASTQPDIAKQFQVSSWPTDLVLTARGQELHRMTSPQDPNSYLAELGKAAWRSQSLDLNAKRAALGRRDTRFVQAQAQTPTPTPTTSQSNLQNMAAAQTPAAGLSNAAAAYPASRTPRGDYQATFFPANNARSAERKPYEGVATAVANQPQHDRANFFIAPTAANVATSSPTGAAATAATRQLPVNPAPASAQINPFASQTPRPGQLPAAHYQAQAPQRTPPHPANVPDLYPQDASGPHLQLQSHTSAQEQSLAARIPTAANRTGVQPASHEQPNAGQAHGIQFPQGKNPFDGTNTGAGAVMLNNPFSSTGSVSPPATPAPRIPAPSQPVRPIYPPNPQPSQNPQMGAGVPPTTFEPAARPQVPDYSAAPAQPLQPQPDPQIRTAAQPQLAAPRPAAANLPPAFVAMKAPVQPHRGGLIQPPSGPTPALTPATPPTVQPNTVEDAPSPAVENDDDEDLAMDGYCPVTLHHEDRWVKGNEKWGALHRGKVFLFRTPESQERFLNDPDKYSPLLSGYDPVVFHETGELKAGFRAHGIRYQEMTCLFCNEETLRRFWESPWQFSQTAKQAMHAGTSVR